MSLYNYFICLLRIVNFVNENTNNAIANIPNVINNVVIPAFGNVTGGSASFNLGVTSDVFTCSVSSKSK